MGYNTDFSGVLTYKNPITDEELEYLNTFMDEDCRDHPEWGRTDLTWIDLMCDEDGIQWNGSEKTYDLVEKINLIIDQMRKKFPGFELEGALEAKGEKFDDYWILDIEDGRAVMKTAKIVVNDEINYCPHCGEPI